MKFFNQFRASAREFKNLRSLVLASLLLAIYVVLAVFVSVQVTDTLRISTGFLAQILTGILFGPVVGTVSALVGDTLQLLIKPTGAWFYGWSLNAGLTGLVYGIAFYGKLPRRNNAVSTDKKPGFFVKFLALDLKFLLRTLIAVTIVHMVINAGLGTYWCTVVYGKQFMIYFTTRFIKNLVEIPLNTVMTYYLLRALSEVGEFRRMVAESIKRRADK